MAQIRIFDVMFVFILITGFLIVSTLSLFFLGTLEPMFVDLGTNGEDSVELIQELESNIKRIDTLMALLVLMIGVLNFLAGYFMRDAFWFFFVELLFYLFGIVIVVFLNNIIEVFVSTVTIWTPFLIDFPITQLILMNMVPLYIALSSFYLIGRYAKKNIFIV